MISDAFKREKAFIAYITAGDGGINYSFEAALALIAGGVDLLEIGIPFSDPIADGPVIQQAMQRSLKEKTTPQGVLELVKKLRDHTSIPIVLFGYFNPMLQAGPSFFKDAKKAGADGVLIVDLPLDEKIDLAGLERIALITPATSLERMSHIAKQAEGFIYYVIQKGTTGMRKDLAEETLQTINSIRERSRLPIAAGFGISSRETAAKALTHADGFVVGSLFVDAMGRKISPEELKKLAESIDPRRPK